MGRSSCSPSRRPRRTSRVGGFKRLAIAVAAIMLLVALVAGVRGCMAACVATQAADEADQTPVQQQPQRDPIDVAKLKAVLGDDLAAQLVQAASASDEVAWIAAHPDAYAVDGGAAQRTLLKLAVVEPEAVPFVRTFPDAYPAESALGTDDPASGEVPRLYQWDPRWGSTVYSSTTFALTGCCPTSLSMVCQGLTGKGDLSPYDMGKRASDGGFETAFDGTDFSFLVNEAASLGLSCEALSVDAGSVRATLEGGAVLVCNVGPGDFTDNGHFFVVTGTDGGGNLRINDPYSANARTRLGTWTRCSARRRRCGLTGSPEDADACAGNASSTAKHGKKDSCVFWKEDAKRERRNLEPPRRSRQILIACTIFPCRFDDIEASGDRAWYNAPMADQTQITLTAPRSVSMALIVGPADEILHVVQDAFASRITVRGDTVELVGDPLEVQSLTALFSDLIKLVEGGGEPTLEYVRHAIDLLRTAEFSPQALREDILLTYRGRAIRPKTAGQKRYVDAIRRHAVTFGIGPAGTGKTYLAMAMAVAALKRKEVGRIILTRPVVEAGESLGFLPGTLAEKVDPYIRPLYDALFDMADTERATQLVESGVIEIAPLAFMRGRTLNDSFIILDEAQNTTPEQMKMFLTRLGFGSKMVITGDVTQLDLPHGVSGLKGVRAVLEDIDDIAFCDFTGKDVVRHSLVAAIVSAYDQASRKA